MYLETERGAMIRTELLRFNGAVEWDSAIDAWMKENPLSDCMFVGCAETARSSTLVCKIFALTVLRIRELFVDLETETHQSALLIFVAQHKTNV